MTQKPRIIPDGAHRSGLIKDFGGCYAETPAPYTGQDLIASAIDHAERGASKLRFFDPTAKYASEELYEAWDQLQAASETVRDAMHKLGFRDPRA